jgi:hypothetical protein
MEISALAHSPLLNPRFVFLHNTVFNLHPWSTESPEEIFSAPGRRNKLQIKAAELRTAHHHRIDKKKSVHDVRAVRPLSGEK